MRTGRIRSVLIVGVIAAACMLVPTVPAMAHGSCTLFTPMRETSAGKIELKLQRVCGEGHARLRMTAWIDRKLSGGSWTQIGPSYVLECLQCRRQDQVLPTFIGYDGCVHNAAYRIHVSSANIFNANGDNVTSSHTQYYGVGQVLTFPVNLPSNSGRVLC
jgi:hypothetical protein